MNKEKFIKDWMCDSFYWLEGGRLGILQEVAFKLGLTWHTGEQDYVSSDYPHNNLWFSKESKMQSLDFYNEGASYGEPKDFLGFIQAWDKLDKNEYE